MAYDRVNSNNEDMYCRLGTPPRILSLRLDPRIPIVHEYFSSDPVVQQWIFQFFSHATTMNISVFVPPGG